MSGRYAAPEPNTAGSSAGSRTNAKPFSYGHVQPLVAVGDHRVGALDALDQMPRARRQRREQAEGAVHVEPGAVPFGELGHVVQRVEVAGVHLAGAADHDRGRAVELAERGLHRDEVDPSDVVAGELPHAAAPDAQHPSALTSLGWV